MFNVYLLIIHLLNTNFSVAPVGFGPFAVNVITERKSDIKDLTKPFFHSLHYYESHVMTCNTADFVCVLQFGQSNTGPDSPSGNP